MSLTSKTKFMKLPEIFSKFSQDFPKNQPHSNICGFKVPHEYFLNLPLKKKVFVFVVLRLRRKKVFAEKTLKKTFDLQNFFLQKIKQNIDLPSCLSKSLVMPRFFSSLIAL